MREPVELSRRDARRLFLLQQGLLHRAPFGRGPTGALNAIRRKSYLQIDTISVVARAHEHILASRVPGFRPTVLDRLQRDRRIFEHWSHAAAFLPFESYRFALPLMKGVRERRRRDERLARTILERIRAEGPLRSKDFEDSRASPTSGWWDHKPAKQALERLFLGGELMVSARDGFQKVFDLPEHVIPDGVDTRMPTEAEWADHINLSMAEALGPATAADLAYARPTYRRLSGVDLRRPLAASLARLTEEGRLIPVSIEGAAGYMPASLTDALPVRLGRVRVRFLSPFDNLVINRKRALDLFGFDYRLECYVPAAKRKYGYFALPVLFGDTLVGRMDTKADRRQGVMVVKNLALEPGTDPASGGLLEALAEALPAFSHDLDCGGRVRIDKTSPAKLAGALRRALVG